ncbi:cytochrome P450 CYP12A2-like isoform X2 [Anthonomus grandis grandis]|uniref:cytochrome P450 CYP12A2-like isoform X2 n=1 Tax=Anthonomus grandis grandis TaxID=2921223 RepID=UPI0021665A02|nr:cytochrome P450 CYP12A2-like isoform X2 [Anthonomus grandis grandis]
MLRFSARVSPLNLAKIRRINAAASYAAEAKVAETAVPQSPVVNAGSTDAISKPQADVVVPKMPDIPKSIEIPSVQKFDSNVCPFDAIPGPHSLRYISKFWSYVPLLSAEFTGGALFQAMNLGKFFGNLLSWGGNARFFQKFFNVYGPVVRLHGPFGGDVVLLSRPEHASIVFQNEGQQPVRACLDSVEKYRLQHRRLRQAGPFLMSGPEWEKIHESLEKPLQTSAELHFKTIDSISDQFVDRLLSIRNLQDEVPGTFKNEILKWCLECMCSVAMKRKLGFLDPTGLSPTSDPGRILGGVNGASEAIRKCEYGFHVWKFIETPAWRSLVRNCDAIDSILSKYIERAQSAIREKKDLKSPSEFSLIESLLLKDDVLVEDVMTVMLDMLLIGANATAHSVAFLLYHLAKAPKCQRKLYDELMKQGGDVLTPEKLKNMPYLQACLKESMRLSPPIPILNRVLAKDAIIHRYKIPKGTYVLIAVHLASLREEYFEDARKFMPERWLSGEVSPLAKDLQVFASMPFGYGPKSCQAKELAQMEIGLLTSKILKRFIVEYNYGEIESSNSLLATPAKPLKFRFVDRL